MDYENMLRDAFSYTKEGVFEKINRWMLLIIATFILTIPLLGYIAKILRAEKPAPEVRNWVTLFVDGIKMLIVEIVYFIPIILIWIVGMFILGPHTASSYGTSPYGSYLASYSAASPHHTVHPTVSPTTLPPTFPIAYPTVNPGLYTAAYPTAGIAGAGLLGLLNLLLVIIIGILLPIAMVRFARSGNFSDAFNFKAILDYIRKIGWISYIMALIIGGVVVGIPVFIILFIISAIITLALGFSALLVLPVVLGIIYLIIAPLISVFLSRYITRVYDSVAA
jgi:hypothetical protein